MSELGIEKEKTVWGREMVGLKALGRSRKAEVKTDFTHAMCVALYFIIGWLDNSGSLHTCMHISWQLNV